MPHGLSPTTETALSAAAAARIWQINLAARGVQRFTRSPAGQRISRRLANSDLAEPVFRAVLGYRRTFDTLEHAQQAIAPYSNRGHVHPDNAAWHLDFGESPRPSDYAAMFHLLPVLPDTHRVFDLGGNLGNLYYCYARYLTFADDLRWLVCDLPEHMLQGAELAEQRQARAVRFTADWEDASGADLLVASGSLHYFATPLPAMIAALREPPHRLLINRTPLTDASTAATVQEAGSYRVACMLYNRTELVDGLKQLGYRVVDSWAARELSLAVPNSPEHTVHAYSGLFLVR